MIEEIEPSSTIEEAFGLKNGKLEVPRDDFIERIIATKILKDNSLYTLESTDEFVFYDKGVYKRSRNATNLVRRCITKVGNNTELVSLNPKDKTVNRSPYKLSGTKRAEIEEQIRTASFIREYDFDTEKNRICVLNGHIIIGENKIIKPGLYETGIDKLQTEIKDYSFTPHVKYDEAPYKTFFQLPLTYDAEATCPNIEKFLNNIVGEENVDFMYEMLGYFLFPTIEYQKAFIFYGPPSSGKTTFIENLLYRFIGGIHWEDVISNVKLHELSEKFMLTELQGKMLNVWDDLKDDILTETDGFRIAVTNTFLRDKIKHVQQHAYWRNLCKQVFSCNDLPEMKKDPREQFWRRWILVDFFSLFTDDVLVKGGRIFKKDPNIEAKITTPAEFSGLLNKCIDGFIRLKKRGAFENKWNDPEYIKGLWLININPVKLFVDECCEKGSKFEVDYEVFHKKLNKFRQNKNVASITPTMMTRSMKALNIKGFNANKKMAKKYHPESCGRNYVGIKLKGDVYDATDLRIGKIDEFEEYEKKQKKSDDIIKNLREIHKKRGEL